MRVAPRMGYHLAKGPIFYTCRPMPTPMGAVRGAPDRRDRTETVG